MFVLLLFVLLGCAYASVDELQEEKLCSNTLESTIYQPKSCGQEYLRRVNKDLKRSSALLFTPQRDSIVANLEQQYGVQITITEPFSSLSSEVVKCDTFAQGSYPLATNGPNNFVFDELSAGTFVSASLTHLDTQLRGDGFSSTISLTSPGNVTQSVYNNTCTNIQGFKISFSDNGNPLTNVPNCRTQVYNNNNRTILPTQPFGIFNGTEVQGSWNVSITVSTTLQLNSFNLNICYLASSNIYPRDMAFANLNLPAYSRENGLSKLSSILRNPVGDELSISITANNLSC